MEVAPASFDQIVTTPEGDQVVIDADVGGVAAELKRIDPGLFLVAAGWRGRDGYWVVGYRDPGGEEYRVFTARELDHRIVQRAEELSWRVRHGVNVADYADRLDDERKREADASYSERVRGTAERLYYALERERGQKPRIYVP
jgi:hypothetical protein